MSVIQCNKSSLDRKMSCIEPILFVIIGSAPDNYSGLYRAQFSGIVKRDKTWPDNDALCRIWLLMGNGVKIYSSQLGSKWVISVFARF